LNYTAIKALHENVLVPLVGPRSDQLQLEGMSELVGTDCSHFCWHNGSLDEGRTLPHEFQDVTHALSYMAMSL
jgi:hypothetical protein